MKKKWLLIGFCLIPLSIFVLWGLLETPLEVKNTVKACDWCESTNEARASCCCGWMTCSVCLEDYMDYHNFTEYPHYCWTSDEFAPSIVEWELKKVIGWLV